MKNWKSNRGILLNNNNNNKNINNLENAINISNIFNYPLDNYIGGSVPVVRDQYLLKYGTTTTDEKA